MQLDIARGGSNQIAIVSAEQTMARQPAGIRADTPGLFHRIKKFVPQERRIRRDQAIPVLLFNALKTIYEHRIQSMAPNLHPTIEN